MLCSSCLPHLTLFSTLVASLKIDRRLNPRAFTAGSIISQRTTQCPGVAPLVLLAAAGPHKQGEALCRSPIRGSAPLSLPLSWASWPVTVRGTAVDLVGPDRRPDIVICEKGGWTLVVNLLFLRFAGRPTSMNWSQLIQSHWWIRVSHAFRSDHVKVAGKSLTCVVILNVMCRRNFRRCGSVPFTRIQDLETRVDASTHYAVQFCHVCQVSKKARLSCPSLQAWVLGCQSISEARFSTAFTDPQCLTSRSSEQWGRHGMTSFATQVGQCQLVALGKEK